MSYFSLDEKIRAKQDAKTNLLREPRDVDPAYESADGTVSDYIDAVETLEMMGGSI